MTMNGVSHHAHARMQQRGVTASLLDLLDNLATVLGVLADPNFTAPRAGDVKHTRADCSAASRDLGFTARVPFDEGLRRTVEWFEHRAAGRHVAREVRADGAPHDVTPRIRGEVGVVVAGHSAAPSSPSAGARIRR